jgi:Phospholipase B
MKDSKIHVRMKDSKMHNTHLDDGYRFERHGWTFLHIEGGPHERGFQHGWLLAPDIGEALAMTADKTVFTTGDTFAFFVEAAERLFAGKLDEEIETELRAIAEGATAAGTPVSFGEILAWNAYIELLWNWWPLSNGRLPRGPRRRHHCSAFIASGSWTTDGGVVMAHNTWDDYTNANAFRVVVDLVPRTGHRIFMHTAPGLIHSATDFFVTGAGLMGTETSIAGFNGYDESKSPEFYRARRAMQHADTLDQWIAMMKADNNGGYANSWLLGNAHTGEIARLEMGLRFIGDTRASDGFFWGCNLVADPRIRNQECTGIDYCNINDDAARRVRWEDLLQERRGHIDLAVARSFIADHWDEYTHRDAPSARTICGHFDEFPDAFPSWGFGPFEPFGANDGKVTDSRLARELSFVGRIGHPCGQVFDAARFLKAHPQYRWQQKWLRDKPLQPWTEFRSDQRA